MKKFILPFLLLIQYHVFAETYNKIKIFDRQSHIEAGIDFGCYFWGLNARISPDALFTNDGNQLDLLLSVTRNGWVKLCSPAPPEFTDQGRYYYSLGDLPPGNYSLSVKYVFDDGLPPDPTTTIHDYAQRTFQIAHPIPAISIFGLFVFTLLLLIIVKIKLSKKLKKII